MTSKKKLKRRIAELERDIACALHDKQVIRKRWIDGEQPTWIDRMQFTNSDKTPMLNFIKRGMPIDPTNTKAVWGISTEEGIAGEA